MANLEETNTKVTNEAGCLVWVCRPDGTWWPGQILSIDQVMEKNWSPRRTGTPVKLLGKEDDCVDWYDVEASEQIKAFRCGEFDECIEKANAILHALQLERAQKVEDDIEQEMTSASVPKRSTHLQLDLNRSPDYNEMIISLPDVSGCDRVKTLFEEPAITEPGSSSMHASGASQKLELGCEVDQVKVLSNDVKVLDDDVTDAQIRSSGGNIGCDEDDDAPKNYGERRSQGMRGPYELRAKPRGSTKFVQTCPAPKKLKRVSSEHTSLSNKIPKVKNIEKH